MEESVKTVISDRQIAEAATPRSETQRVTINTDGQITVWHDWNPAAVGAFIAHFNPQKVLAMLDEIDRSNRQEATLASWNNTSRDYRAKLESQIATAVEALKKIRARESNVGFPDTKLKIILDAALSTLEPSDG